LLYPRQQADGYWRMRIVVTSSQKLAVRREDVDDIPGRRLSVEPGHVSLVDPQVPVEDALFVSWLERCRCHHDPSFAVAVGGLPADRLPRKAKHIFAPDLLTRFDESHAPVERPRDGIRSAERRVGKGCVTRRGR